MDEMNKSTACQELIIIGTESKDVSHMIWIGVS